MWGRVAQLSLTPNKLQGFTQDKKANWYLVILFVECCHSNAGHVKKKKPEKPMLDTCVHKAEKTCSEDMETIFVVNKMYLLFTTQNEIC